MFGGGMSFAVGFGLLEGPVAGPRGVILVLAAIGLVMGGAQSLLLRRADRGGASWALASAASIALSMSLGLALEGEGNEWLVFVVALIPYVLLTGLVIAWTFGRRASLATA
jgi:hypothetical protein